MQLDSDIVDDIYDNEFEDYHLDTIISIFFELKKAFTLSPFFLSELKSTDLTNFFIESKNTRTCTHKDEIAVMNSFYNFYINEINISYDNISNFLPIIKKDSWISFCYKYSDLYEFIR